jgi:hypothetical protein
MRLEQVKREIKDLGKSPVAEKLYPITSDWVPITDVLAIVNRFEKYWKQRMETTKNSCEAALMKEILGEVSEIA